MASGFQVDIAAASQERHIEGFAKHMDKVFELGPRVFAAALFCLGFQQFLGIAWAAGPIPGPPWDTGLIFLACCFGVILLASALAIAWKIHAQWAAAILAALLFGRTLIVYLPHILASPHKPYAWTSGFELLAMAGACLALLTTCAAPHWKSAWLAAGRIGQIIFAASLVVFGVQHFIYAQYVATLVPSWIPARLFWAIFAGVAFVAAAVSILAQKLARLAKLLLGTMFLLWFLILHLPRVAGALRNGNEWTSALVALTMGGAAWTLGWAHSHRNEEQAAGR